jgi:hypothetical protein
LGITESSGESTHCDDWGREINAEGGGGSKGQRLKAELLLSTGYCFSIQHLDFTAVFTRGQNPSQPGCRPNAGIPLDKNYVIFF